MSRPFALLFAFFLIAAADSGPRPHASGRPDGPGPGCGGGFTAARGDTLYSIARRCETSVAELVQENRLGRRPGLEPGQRLAIPGFDVPVVRPHGPPGPDRSQILPPPPSAVRPLPRPASPPERGPPPGDLYHVQAGDTLYSLARWARTSLAALRAANPDVDPRDIEIGDPIRLPRGAVRPESLRLRERGRTAPAVAPPPPPPAPSPPAARPPRPPVALPPPPPEADKPADDDEDEGTPGGMDDGGPEPEGM